MTFAGFKNHINLTTFTACFVLIISFFSLINLFSWDEKLALKLLHEEHKNESIVVLKIDSKTLGELGAWPWTREKHAQIIEKILQSEPKKLGLDIVYQDKPEEISGSSKLNSIIKDSRIVAGYLNNPGVVPDPTVYKDVNIATVEVPIENGFIHKVNSSIEGLDSLSKRVSGVDEVPQTYLINTKATLPTSISLIDFLENPNLQNFIKDKYVFIGSTSPSLGDIYQFPETGQTPGVYIHALSLNQILENNFYNLKKPNFAEIIVFSIVYSLMISIIVKRKKFLSYGLIILSLTVILMFIPLLFQWFSIGLTLSFLISGIIILSWSGLIYSLRQKRQLFRILNSYLSPQHLSKVLLSSRNLNLGGEKYNCSLMFTDIRGFTTISEKLDPKEVGNLLNTILGYQAEIILNNGGVVDKFIGDAVMAFWGAPILSNDHAFLALKTAGELVEKLEYINRNRHEPIEIGVGLDSGDVVVGNFGSSKRLNYTALGDTVNTASRVEHMCKEYFAQILLTSKVIQKLSETEKQHFVFEPVDKIKPRGKTEDVVLYELISYRKDLSSDYIILKQPSSEDYKKALELYFSGKCKQAKKLFIKVNTPRSLYLSQRCQI